MLLLDFYLSGSKPLTEKSYVGFHLLVSFVTSFSSGYIYFVIMFSSFSADYITESPFYSDSSCLTLILTMNLNLGTSGENLKEGTVLFTIHNFLINQKSIIQFKMTQIIYCVYSERYKIIHVIFGELVLERFYECILQ